MVDPLTPEARDQLLATLATQHGMTDDVLVEIAGAAVAVAVADQLGSVKGRTITALVGAALPGAIAAVAAHRLLAWGTKTFVLLSRPSSELRQLTVTELSRFESFGGRVYEPGAPFPPTELWIDGMHQPYQTELNETADRAELDALETLIETVNHDGAPIVAVDAPTGLDLATGKATVPAIRANHTLTLGYPTTGLLKSFARQLVGRLSLIDLGLPAINWRAAGVATAPLFNGKLFILWTD